MSLGKLGRVDEKFGETLNRVRKELEKIGVTGITDRQASKVVATIFENYNFNFNLKSKKRRDIFEIQL